VFFSSENNSKSPVQLATLDTSTNVKIIFASHCFVACAWDNHEMRDVFPSPDHTLPIQGIDRGLFQK
jgi:hypothetical protein